MISYLPRYLFNFVFFTLIQVLVLNNIQLSGYVNPYLYILFIITLPFETPGWLLLLLGFTSGMAVDLFSNTPGMHASATVFVSFLRPYVLRLFAPREEYQPGTIPTMAYYGLGWFLRYAAILVLGHHLFLFFIEVFSLTHFFSTLLRALSSTVFTLILIIVAQLFSQGKKQGR
ncbi:rod shape-determining protein MreD [Carboxylicivirga mesophila]|uniref:Rod shape-determining protein MreD n=1 Tax=Carboxylicivirga mesophila TaxID=1166478 RepID=A0ABS5KE57_9BACT|nr:rod shape-determining protein MreD [Carboxylicivirga mesophila]MBS2212613.1 rod shape-determining protein MreD [Carboxylicivirga mesophila]